MGQLGKLGIVADDTKAAATAFAEIFPDFTEFKALSPSDYISNFWDRYQARINPNENLNGKVFEYLLATAFVRDGLFPLFLNAKVAFVPNVNFDLMFYTREKGPICISAKTSLRERYKQADLESIALKNVHRKAQSYLVTLDVGAAKTVKAKIKSGDVIGLEDVVVATDREFDELIQELKKLEFCKPETVEVVTSSLHVTAEKVASLL